MVADNLYPEVVSAGSLRRAIDARARELRAPWGLGKSNWRTDDMVRAVVETANGEIRVGLGAEERTFVVSVWRAGAVWLSGATPELDSAVMFISAWNRGISLADARATWPFLTYDRLAEAHERGNAVAVKWELLEGDPGADYVREAVAAAAARPELRQLFPWLSHLGSRLHFSRCTGYPFSRGIPYIEGQLAGYRVIDDWSDEVLGEFLDPVDAVAAVVAAMPQGIGPAIEGDRSALLNLDS